MHNVIIIIVIGWRAMKCVMESFSELWAGFYEKFNFAVVFRDKLFQRISYLLEVAWQLQKSYTTNTMP